MAPEEQNADFVQLYNTSEIDQAAYADGKRYVMTAQEIRFWPKDVATAFLTQRGRYVQVYKAVYIPPSPGEDLVWLANVTGNPFLPETLTKTRFDRQRGFEESFEIPNPKRTAAPLEFEMQAQQIIKEGKYGYKESWSMPPKRIKIPPRTRIPCPRSTAEWLIRRDSQMGEDRAGSLIECRAPSGFEPNESWSLEDTLIYAEMVDSQRNWKKLVPKDGSSEAEKQIAILTGWLFYRLVDERYALVDRQSFEARKAELAAVAATNKETRGKGQAGASASA